MPPKKLGKGEVESKKKAVDDKTFGLKNKNKSTKVAAYVHSIQTSLAVNLAKRQGDGEAKKAAKKSAEEQARELAGLMVATIKQPKVPEGVDPKSIVCEFFRHGQCTKGTKCKFSHDLNADRKGPKISLFADQREIGQKEEGMEDWDQAKLEEAIASKHEGENQNIKTEIICRFFLEAVEKKAYGWFWKCPNGGECKYRHALPAGYVLKSQMKELLEEQNANRKDVADLIEEERSRVVAKTPITGAVMKEWLRQRAEHRRSDQAEEEFERRRKGILNGREIFLEAGFQAVDDESAAEEYVREEGDVEAKIELMMAQSREAEAAARAAAGMPQESGDGSSGTGASSSQGPSTTLKLAAEDAALFDDDEDDGWDGDMQEGDEEGGAGEGGTGVEELSSRVAAISGQ